MHDPMHSRTAFENEHWLRLRLPRHARLTVAVVALIEGMLNARNIEYLSVTGRTKSLKSALEKIEKKKYKNPEEQITDISGIRVITFLEDQVSEIEKVIEELFEIDNENSLDRSSVLGLDRVGYRSTHYVGNLGSERARLPEYSQLEGLKFEVQLRTVLQHAWAELAHDRSFKFKGTLPSRLQRELNLYAGLLELADSGFNKIAREIDEYSYSIESSPSEFNATDINDISISQFIKEIAKENDIEFDAVEMQLDPVIAELKLLGIDNIGKLKILVTDDFIKNYKRFVTYDTPIGFVRSVLMYEDLEKYFSHWKKSWWNQFEDQGELKLLSEKYGYEDVKKILVKKGVMDSVGVDES